MNNEQLFFYHFERKVRLRTVIEIIDYWYDWIFNYELKHKVKELLS